MFEFTKQPAETYTIAVEFEGKLPSAASLSSGTFAAYDPTGANVSGAILSGTAATISGTQARIKVLGGTHGLDYRVRLVATLTNADILEEDGVMHVVNS